MVPPLRLSYHYHRIMSKVNRIDKVPKSLSCIGQCKPLLTLTLLWQCTDKIRYNDACWDSIYSASDMSEVIPYPCMGLLDDA